MRFSLNKIGDSKSSADARVYSEETFKKEFEKAVQNGDMYSLSLKKAKRFRSAFTTEQVKYLEKEFRKYPYVGNSRRKDVASVLNIPERAVKIWFQNRRMKEKKDNNKESNSDKAARFMDPLNNIAAKHNNNGTLPVLVSPTASGNIDENVACKIDIVQEEVASSSTRMENSCSQVNESSKNPTVIITPASSTVVYPNSSTSLEPEEKPKEKTKTEAAESSSDYTFPSSSSYAYINKTQDLSFGSYPSSSLEPQDLSLKSTTISSQQNVVPNEAPDIKYNSSEVPVYLRGFYAQPYIPPSNMIWRPVNMAPMVPTPVTMVPGLGSSTAGIKRNCTCDCHKPYPAPLILNNSGSNLHYVVTAVPMQNTGTKF